MGTVVASLPMQAILKLNQEGSSNTTTCLKLLCNQYSLSGGHGMIRLRAEGQQWLLGAVLLLGFWLHLSSFYKRCGTTEGWPEECLHKASTNTEMVSCQSLVLYLSP